MRQNINLKTYGFTAILAIFPFTTVVADTCYTSDNSISVQADSGNGNYDCSALIDKDGSPLQDLTLLADTVVAPVGGDMLTWTLVDSGLYEDGRPKWDVRFVSVNSSGNGQRCNYMYPEVDTSDTVAPYSGSTDSGLGESSTKETTYVNVCASITPIEYDQPVTTDWVTTYADACEATITAYEDNTSTIVNTDITFGYTTGSKDGTSTIAICSDTGVTTENTQIECAPNDGAALKDLTGLDCTANPDGSLPLDCFPTAFSPVGSDLKYCSYYQSKVCDPTDAASYSFNHFCDTNDDGVFIPYDATNPDSDDRYANTYIPTVILDEVEVRMTVTKGSYTYTPCSYGRCFYSY